MSVPLDIERESGPRIDVMIGDISVVVEGGNSDTLDDVETTFDRKYEQALADYREANDIESNDTTYR